MTTLRAYQLSSIRSARLLADLVAVGFPDPLRDGLVAHGVVRHGRAEPGRILPRGAEAAPADAPVHRRVEIRGDHRQPVLPGQLEEGPIHGEVGPALRAPLELPIDVRAIRVAPHGGVERGLPGFRHHLERERRTTPVGQEGLEDPGLDGVMLRVVVQLPEVHDLRLLGAVGDQPDGGTRRPRRVR